MKRSNIKDTSFLADILAYEARTMIAELRDSPMLVVLMPAPDTRHVGHMIRVVVSRPPGWYMDRFYSQKGRKTFKRAYFLKALERVANRQMSRGNYQDAILEYLNEKIRDGK